MAIVKMNKLSVIGLDANKNNLVKQLMDFGVVELNMQDSKMADENWSQLVHRGSGENEVALLDVEIAKAATALETLDRFDVSKRPLIKTRKAVSDKAFAKVMDNRDEIKRNIDFVCKLSQELADLKSAENKFETSILTLKPWLEYSLPLEVSETKHVSAFIGVVPNIVQTSQLILDVQAKTDKTVLTIVGSDSEQHYLCVLCLKVEKEDVLDCLKQYGFNPVVFKDMQGTSQENTAQLMSEILQIKEKRTKVEQEIGKIFSFKNDIEYVYDALMMERDRARAQNRLLETKRTFYLDGWLPAVTKESVGKLLQENDCYYEITEPKAEEETPVLLKQNGFAQPFEAITNLYALPNSKSIDPTAFLAPFYFIFFGLMLSDAGYGIVMTVACFILLKKFRLEGMMHKLIKMFFYCGISTTIWGALFGGWFGDIIPVVANTFFGVDITNWNLALWFNPVADPMKLLIFSFILGAIHLFTGMGIQAYLLIRDGKVIDAICDIGFWYVLLVGLVMFGLGASLPPALAATGQWMSIVGALGLLLTGGRNKKGFLGKLTGGLGSLYNITSYLSDVLSYSRLLALGLATGVIATVINTMGTLAGGGIGGAIVLVVVFVFGHTFNIAINALGSFVHSSRLQYVEFFGKFFESGGVAFNPLSKKTKYVEIIREEN